jgi:hypothetical protein
MATLFFRASRMQRLAMGIVAGAVINAIDTHAKDVIVKNRIPWGPGIKPSRLTLARQGA